MNAKKLALYVVVRSYYRQAFVSYPNVHYLENDSVEIDGVRFLGATFWSSFNCFGLDRQLAIMEEIHYYCADFQYIKIDDNNRQFVPSDMLTLHNESRVFLQSELPKYDPKKTVVVTHFPPLFQLKHGTIRVDIGTAYFQAHALDIVEEHKPAFWLYGHNHWSENKVISATRFVSNQPGYPKEDDSLRRYRKDLVLKI
ncbi:MAG: hypothetical protein V7744_15000 [Pseudomonadales bacterium]